MKEIKLLFMDADGTLTDGKLYMGPEGEALKTFDVKDGCGIHDILPRYEIIPVVLTARTSQILSFRCRELGIEHLYQGCSQKGDKMLEVAGGFDIVPNAEGILEKTAYIGDDLPDAACMKLAEYSGCPHNAVNEIRKLSHFVSRYNGGCGAVRDFIEWLLS